MEFDYRLVQSVQFSKSVRRFNLLSSLSGSLKSRKAEGTSTNPIEKYISSAASIISSSVEKYTAKKLGMTLVPTISGSGASPDLVSPNPTGISLVAEIKAIVPEFSTSVIERLKGGKNLSTARRGIIGFKSPISITTSGIDISAGRSKELTVGFIGAKNITKSFDNDTIDAFYRAYSTNLNLLKEHLSNPSASSPIIKPLVKALRLNLFLKAKSIFIPVAINNRTVLIGHISFKSQELFSNKNSFVDLSFSDDGAILVNLKIPAAVLNSAFREASEGIFNELNTNALLDSVESFMETNIANKAETLSKDYVTAIKQAEAILKKNRIKVSEMHAKGSVITSSIKVKYPKTKEKTREPSRELSILDITMLVRGRTKLKMRRGSAAPSPPKIYERSGAFRGSIEAVANMNTDIINYFYTPYYDALQRYGYTIQDMVEGSIRDIARERLGGQFILRKNTQTII